MPGDFHGDCDESRGRWDASVKERVCPRSGGRARKEERTPNSPKTEIHGSHFLAHTG